MIFRKRTPTPTPTGSGAARLEQAVRAHLSDSDEDTTRIVIAVAGLLASVAYADRDYADTEQAQIQRELERVQGLGSAGVTAICNVLQNHIQEVATVNPQAYTRLLREHAHRDLRCEVLDVLVDLAAADDEVSMAEADLLRRTASAMGLSQDDYNEAQARHRARLSVLK